MLLRIFYVLIFALSPLCLFGAGEGRPLKEGTFDLPELFKNPPSGYGEVPFYWWMGDKLDKAHLLSHLDELEGKGVQSLQVNYAHSDRGGRSWGLTYKSDPPLMSNEWWSLFAWFRREANKRGMSVSLSDYTLGVGQEQFVDRAISENPNLKAAALFEERIEFDGNFRKLFEYSKTPLCVALYKLDSEGKIISNSRENLASEIVGGALDLERKGRNLLICVYPRPLEVSFDPTNPESGKLYTKHFFGEFERRLGGGEGLNFFFSDELDFKIEGRKIWSEYLRGEFKKSKGYDIAEYADLLFVDYPNLSAKIRLDFNDVFVKLSERNFFKPVYDWHESRGMIYGCDHGGRGRKVDEFGDYFRTQRWNQGPGCDQPGGDSDLIKNKVASSIAHMYGRPRVWLEGFHSSGWGQTPSHLSGAIFSNFAMGHNLLSLHGLYYSTMGGWWEWAPPCNHFREPYWREMPELLKCAERLSFLLSQGTHRADIAIMYPLEAKVAGFGDKSVELAFDLAGKLYAGGRDFDFMDAESIERAKYGGGKIRVAGEEFEVLIIPAMEAMRQSTLESIARLAKSGARIWFLEPAPIASDWLKDFPNAKGVKSAESKKLSPSEIIEGIRDCARVFKSKNDLLSALESAFRADFKILSEGSYAPRVLHRKINGDDYYALCNIPQNTLCEFRALGAVSLLEPFTGNERELAVLSQDAEATKLYTPLNSTDFQIIRFRASGKARLLNKNKLGKGVAPESFQILSGKWNFSFKPVLDNSWGDFEWPPTKELIGPQIRFVKLGENPSSKLLAEKSEFEQIGYSAKFLQLGPLAEPIPGSDAARILELFSGKFKELKISMRYGVLGDEAHQGYHGLKAEISDDFIRLGKIERTATAALRLPEEGGKHYYLYTKVYAPREGDFEILSGAMKPARVFINGKPLKKSAHSANLNKGVNELVLHYDSHGSSHFLFIDPKAPQGRFEFAEAQESLSMSWNGMKNILPFDASSDFSKPISFSFESAPALEELRFTLWGEGVSVKIGGSFADLSLIEKREDGARSYRARAKEISKGASKVEIEIAKPREGFGGAAALSGYIRQTCGEGEIELASWDKFEGMRTYSGGVLYSKDFDLEKDKAGKRIVLNLVELGGLARVRLNGKDAGVRFYPPWTFELGDLLKEGKNRLEIEVYNTAANHYLTMPTRYRGDTKSGLISSPRLEFYNISAGAK